VAVQAIEDAVRRIRGWRREQRLVTHCGALSGKGVRGKGRKKAKK
jgi:hypothetical protein